MPCYCPNNPLGMDQTDSKQKEQCFLDCYCGQQPSRKAKRKVKGYKPPQTPPGTKAVVYEPCVHLHFKPQHIERDCLTREQYYDMLATPKGYPWLGEADCQNPELEAKNKSKKKKKKQRKSEQEECPTRAEAGDFADEFVEDMWDVMSPEITCRLIDFLVNEFGMSVEEAEDFIDCKSCVGKQTICKKKKSKTAIGLGPKHKWVKDFSDVFSKRIEQYIVKMLLTRRTPRTKLIAEKILECLSDLVGEKTTLQNPKTTIQKLMVLTSDRLALWIDDMMNDIDKPHKKRVSITEEEEAEEEEGEEEGEEDGEEIGEEVVAEEERKEPPKKESPEKKEEKPDQEEEKLEEKEEEKKEEAPPEKEEEKEPEPVEEEPQPEPEKEEPKPTEEKEETKPPSEEQKDEEPVQQEDKPKTPEKVEEPPVEETKEDKADEPTEDAAKQPPTEEPTTDEKPAAEEEAKPTEDTPDDKDEAPAQEVPPPEEEIPAQEEIPADEEKPEAEEEKPADEEEKPIEEEETPVEEQQVEEGIPEKEITEEKPPEEPEAVKEVKKEQEKKPYGDVLDLVKEDIEGTPKDRRTDRQKADKDEVMRRIEKHLAGKDLDIQPENIDDAASRVAHWMEHVLGSTEPSGVRRRNPSPAYAVNVKSPSTLEVRKLSSGTVAENAANARGVPVPPRERKIPETTSPMNLQSTQEWFDWANNIGKVADDWGKWLESKLTDAEKQIAEKKKADTDFDFKQWKDQAQTEAHKWRVEKEKIKDEGKLWNKKIDKKLNDQPEQEVRSLDM